jgi:hypothetical protein
VTSQQIRGLNQTDKGHNMNQLVTIFDDISYEITNSIEGKQLARNALNAQCRAIAEYRINESANKEQYYGGTEEENEINQGLCFLVQLTQALINFDPDKYRGLNEIFDYLDPDLTDEIDQQEAIAVVRRVMK